MTAARAADHGAALLPLFPDEADEVVLALLGVVIGFDEQDRGYMSLVIDGEQHTPKCPFGQWLAPKEPGQPKGDPCSDRCVTARTAVHMALAWLEEHREATAPEAGRREAV
jgi:hypothetical protein